MKNLKIRFLAVVALLAMGFTVAAHEGAFEKAAIRTDPGTCDAGVDLAGGTFFTNGSCTGAAASIVCTSPHNAFLATKITQTQPTFMCNGGNVFCCAEFAPNQNCPSGGTRDKLTKIICEP